MVIKNSIYLLVFSIFCSWLLFVSGCDHRMDITPFLGPTDTKQADTSYAEMYPPWTGFTSPYRVIIGNDNFIYVADYGANKVLMLDEGGNILKWRTILHPISLAQNSKLDLYVGGETIAPNGIDTIGAIFRIYLARFDTSYIARIETTITASQETVYTRFPRDTSLFFNNDLGIAPMRTVWQEPARPTRRFPGIGIMGGNSYLVARTGSNNASIVDPDTRVLQFTKGDTLANLLPWLQTRPSGGSAITDILDLTNIFILPSTPVRDFIVTQNGPGIAFGAVWMVYVLNTNMDGWQAKFDPVYPDQRGIDFIRSYQYKSAVAVTYDKRRSEVFVLDSELDSVMKFTSKGTFKAESFGSFLTSQQGLPGLNHPMGIAFSSDCILYIADTGNQLIRRFRLSNQTLCQ
ncbi:MAG: hypothetical protein ACHQQQ_06820 [Bacteroidota bacterium]